MELAPGDQLHRQPRPESLLALHQPESAQSDLLDGPERAVYADSVAGAGTQSVLWHHHRSQSNESQWTDDSTLPSLPQHAAVRRRERFRPERGRFVLPRPAGQIGEALLQGSGV